MVKYKLKRVGVVQLSLIMAAIYFLIGLVILLPVGLITSVAGSMSGDDMGLMTGMFSGIMIIFIPIFYAIVGFIGTAISCLIFNFVASRLGGVELFMEVENGEEETV